MTLEQSINQALGRGEFVHLSVVATGTGTGFKATFASASRAGGYSTAEASNPIDAMSKAISAAPMGRKPTLYVGQSQGKTTYTPLVISALTDDEALS